MGAYDPAVLARNKFLLAAGLLGVILGVLPMRPLNAQTAMEQLKANFENPPDDTRPMMRWWWFGLAVEKPEIRRELEQMKADGIGGAELAFVYPQVVDDPAKHLVNEPFLSPPMLDNVSYAASRSPQTRSSPGRDSRQRLALWRSGHHAQGSSGTAFGVAELPVAPGATSLPTVQLAEGESVVSISLVNGEPKHWNAASAQLLTPGQTKDLPQSDCSSHRSRFYRQPHRAAGKTCCRGRRRLGSGSFQPPGRSHPPQRGR